MDYYLKHAAYWDTTADETYARWSKQDEWMTDSVVPALVNAWSAFRFLRSGTSILDLGCGQGILYDRLPEELRTCYVGVDSSYGMLECFTKRHPEATVLVRDIRTIDEPKANIIVCLNTLMYFDDALPETLHSMQRLIDGRPSRVLLTVPLDDERETYEENGRYVFGKHSFEQLFGEVFSDIGSAVVSDLKYNKYHLFDVWV